MIDFPDPKKGREVFEDLYGPERGPRRFRTVLKVLVPLVVIAAILVLIAQITGSTGTIYSTIRGAFAQPAQPSPPAPNGPIFNAPCNNSGTNTGTICPTYNAPPRRENGLYQADQMIGTVTSAKPGPNTGQVTFTGFRISNGPVDFFAPIEFRNEKVRCALPKIPQFPGHPAPSAPTHLFFDGDFTCDIVEASVK
jgi:hypothetical protein